MSQCRALAVQYVRYLEASIASAQTQKARLRSCPPWSHRWQRRQKGAEYLQQDRPRAKPKQAGQPRQERLSFPSKVRAGRHPGEGWVTTTQPEQLKGYKAQTIGASSWLFQQPQPVKIQMNSVSYYVEKLEMARWRENVSPFRKRGVRSYFYQCSLIREVVCKGQPTILEQN